MALGTKHFILVPQVETLRAFNISIACTIVRDVFRKHIFAETLQIILTDFLCIRGWTPRKHRELLGIYSKTFHEFTK